MSADSTKQAREGRWKGGAEGGREGGGVAARLL
jgi:hypothetical protein